GRAVGGFGPRGTSRLDAGLMVRSTQQELRTPSRSAQVSRRALGAGLPTSPMGWCSASVILVGSAVAVDELGLVAGPRGNELADCC
ncbi:MAG: hypothetical protein KDA59_17940, partial [Planctomycetales bacterium]|nr:hypothetical protein [Planctomycetales bacterium]